MKYLNVKQPPCKILKINKSLATFFHRCEFLVRLILFRGQFLFHFEFVCLFQPTQDLKQFTFQLVSTEGEISDVLERIINDDKVFAFPNEEYYFEVSGSFVEWKP